MADETQGVAAFTEDGRTVTRLVSASGEPGAEVRWDPDAEGFVGADGDLVDHSPEPATISPDEWSRGFARKADAVEALAGELADAGKGAAAERRYAQAAELRETGGVE